MRSKPVLSICIPTRNRSECLKCNLMSILKQKPYKDGLVEVLVADNASTDDTQDIMVDFVNRFNVRYIRNNVNIGSEENYKLCINNATGQFIKIINDKVFFLDNSLNEIIKLIIDNQKEMPQIYFSNRDLFSVEHFHFFDFLYRETFRITSLKTISLWSIDKELVNNDSSCDSNRLWCANANLKLAKNKNDVLIVDMKLFVEQLPRMIVFDYPLFKVFHTEFVRLCSKYLERFDDKCFCIDHIEKDLFFVFFRNWVYIYDNRDKDDSIYKFITDENLHEEVFNYCKTKKFYFRWLLCYYEYVIKCKILNLIRGKR